VTGTKIQTFQISSMSFQGANLYCNPIFLGWLGTRLPPPFCGRGLRYFVVQKNCTAVSHHPDKEGLNFCTAIASLAAMHPISDFDWRGMSPSPFLRNPSALGGLLSRRRKEPSGCPVTIIWCPWLCWDGGRGEAEKKRGKTP